MPTKNKPLEMGCGMLYMKTPDGQQVQLGYSTAEITPADEPMPVKTEMGYINPAPSLPEISIELAPTPAFDEWIKSLVQTYTEWLAAYVPQLTAYVMEWARINRPDLFKIWYRTKKKRTRKKYGKRIVREYMEAHHVN